MIKVLVVDDDYNGKVQKIVNLLRIKAGLDIGNIDIVQDTIVWSSIYAVLWGKHSLRCGCREEAS